eukprot:TRINITY_DN1032_c0_g1_i3.p1 TRINITY_DN1032_c0_g1~~TRINITY_DN1032_c0_g1_i3.p1  ORF type:complete len:131 (+),score=34.32 TRINITY_DN1032_c0_g1_i3:166-558(+)
MSEQALKTNYSTPTQQTGKGVYTETRRFFHSGPITCSTCLFSDSFSSFSSSLSRAQSRSSLNFSSSVCLFSSSTSLLSRASRLPSSSSSNSIIIRARAPFISLKNQSSSSSIRPLSRVVSAFVRALSRHL